MCVTRCINSEIPCRSGSPDRSKELVSRHRTSPNNRRPAPWGSRPPKWFNGAGRGFACAGHVQSRMQPALKRRGTCPVLGPARGHIGSMSSGRGARGACPVRKPARQGHVQFWGGDMLILGLQPAGHVHFCGSALGDMLIPGAREWAYWEYVQWQGCARGMSSSETRTPWACPVRKPALPGHAQSWTCAAPERRGACPFLRLDT